MIFTAASVWASPTSDGPELAPIAVMLVVVAIIAYVLGRRSASAGLSRPDRIPRALWVGEGAPREGLPLEWAPKVATLDEAAALRSGSPTDLVLLEQATLARNLTEMERDRDHLILREKCEGMNMLCAGVAHEVANPIGFVTVGAENLQADLEKFKDFLSHMLADEEESEILDAFTSQLDPMQGHIDIILGGCTRIRDITRELQAFARATPGKSRKLIVAHLIENIYGLARTRFKRQAQFAIEGEVAIKVMGNPAELNQVFLNLVLNAVQAIVRRQEKTGDRTPGEVRISLDTDGESARILVRDDGDGIPQERRDHLFSPGRNQRADGGPCLGLHLCQRILEDHGGHIGLGPAEQGTSFVIQLPLAPAEEA